MGNIRDALTIASSCQVCHQAVCASVTTSVFQKSPSTSIDPDTGRVTLLFNPRQHRWADHLAHIGGNIEGKTPVGRTTVSLLEMNGAERLRLRQHLSKAGIVERVDGIGPLPTSVENVNRIQTQRINRFASTIQEQLGFRPGVRRP